MNKLEVNEENILAFLAYKEMGGKHGSSTFFDQYFGNDTFIEYVLKNKELSCNLLIDRHTCLDKDQKLKLLNKTINDKKLLEMFISTNRLRLTMSEYQLIIPKVIKEFPKLTKYIIEMKEIQNPKYVGKLNLDKEVEEKLTGLLVMHRLS